MAGVEQAISNSAKSISSGISNAASKSWGSLSDFALNMVWGGNAPSAIDHNLASAAGRSDYVASLTKWHSDAVEVFGTFSMATLQANRISPRMGVMGRSLGTEISVAAESRSASVALDLGVGSPTYSLRAPNVSGYGGRLGTVDTRAFATHGNSKLSKRTAHLYELWQPAEDGTETFLKYGISQNPAKRYSRSFMSDKEIFPIASGSRTDMLSLERQMVIENPGPLNLEPWAVKARRGQK